MSHQSIETVTDFHPRMADRLEQRSYADIAEVAGISKASIHHRFPTKIDLVRTLDARYREDVQEPIEILNIYAGHWAKCIEDASGPFCICALLASELASLPLFAKCQGQRRVTMHQGRIEYRHRHVALIEQHPDFRAAKNQTIRAAVDKALGDGDIGRLALLGDNIAAKFLVDNPVRLGAVWRFRYDWSKAGPHQPLGVERLLHRESRRHEARRVQSLLLDAGGGGVGNVQHWDGNALHHLVGKLVHCIRGEDDEVRLSTFKGLCLPVQNLAGLFPFSGRLQSLDVCKASMSAKSRDRMSSSGE